MSAYETILVARDGDVMVLTLNRPERLNAAPPQMFDEIRAAIGDLGGARALLVNSTGRAFCSGADLAGRGEAPPPEQPADGGEQTYGALTKNYNPTMLALSELAVPVVTAVRGPAAGIGCSLALCADFCVASETAYFLQAFVNIGLVPDGGSSWMLPRLVGRARANEMMMLGERITAARAAEWGLIHKMVPDGELDETALTLAKRLAAGPTVALGLMRRGAARAAEASFAEAMTFEAENQRHARRTADALEGGRSFLEKRKPAFKGA